MSVWSLRWHFPNKSITGAPYSIKSYSQCRLDVAVKLQQRWCRMNRQWKSIPRSSSSHREGSITQRGASCGWYMYSICVQGTRDAVLGISILDWNVAEPAAAADGCIWPECSRALHHSLHRGELRDTDCADIYLWGIQEVDSYTGRGASRC